MLVAALLPCFRTYWDVGCKIAAYAAPENPYRVWIETYAAPAFGESVARTMATVDAAAEAATPATCDRMMAAYIRCSQYEWLFWDGAYWQRGWPTFG